MSEDPQNQAVKKAYVPSYTDKEAINTVLDAYMRGREVINKNYNYLNGRSIIDCIDDWTKRWNGFIPDQNPLLDATQSQIFLNYTRNAVISYLVKVALTMPDPKIISVNKKNKVLSKKFAEFLKDANTYSLNNEVASKKFFAFALETATKGTGITYEGYLRQVEEIDVPVKFDSSIGKVKTKKQRVVVFDDCFQRLHPVEDFLIANAYEPDIQKQDFIIPDRVTTYGEAKRELGHYSNFEYVQKGNYSLGTSSTPFYSNQYISDLGDDKVQIIPYFCRRTNRHIVLVNGVVIYNGVIPFKDGKYPYAKAIHEPFGNNFFWGASLCNKIMGEQDLKNMLFNMMVDKTSGSLLPYGLTSDLDDLIEDEILAPNKIRKVGDINKWKFDTLPGVTAGEVQMLTLTDRYISENSGDTQGAGSASSPRGGKLAVRQVLMQQQESMQKLGFSSSYLEDYDRDRTELRVNHILQFYSIPKLENITGVSAADQKKLVYRDITVNDTKLSDGRVGNKVIKLVDKMGPSDRTDMADQLSVIEELGDASGTPTEAIAVDVSTFYDYNNSVQIIKNSSYEKNQVLEQSARMEFAQWRLSVAQAAPVNAAELIKWVEESYDFDSARFEGTPGPQQQLNAQAGGNGGGEEGGGLPGGQGAAPAAELARTDNTSALANATQ